MTDDGVTPVVSAGRRPGPTLGDLSEAEILASILPRFGSGRGVVVPAGDDAAVVASPSCAVVATTDSMVAGQDWRDEWSSGADVGVKVVAQNVADIAAMGAVPTGLLVALAADPATPLAWVVDLAEGIAAAAADAGVPVVGGDLSAAPPGVVVVAVTALGDLEGRSAVLRSGARVGDVVAVAGSLGRSGAGLVLLHRGGTEAAARPLEPLAVELIAYHRAPRPPFEEGPAAARAGATSMIDVSDGLAADAGRVARASGVRLELSGAVLREAYAAALGLALGADEAWRQVLGGGEEHALLATFADEASVPSGAAALWRVVGRVVEAGAGGPRLTVDGVVPDAAGWDHFAR
jgi:thiamine-monophosphate kinase